MPEMEKHIIRTRCGFKTSDEIAEVLLFGVGRPAPMSPDTLTIFSCQFPSFHRLADASRPSVVESFDG